MLDGRADDLARKPAIRNSLKHFGADHYIKARERGYVLDVEGGFGITPREHFKGLQEMLPSLKGLAILDNDRRSRTTSVEGRLTLAYWRRYEAENYFVTPDVLRRHALSRYAGLPLFDSHEPDIDEVLDALVLETVFEGQAADFRLWVDAPEAARRLIWDAKTQSTKLSTLAEEFFRRLAQQIGGGMLLTKGELHRLVELVDLATLVPEVREKLDLLHALFQAAGPLSLPDPQTP